MYVHLSGLEEFHTPKEERGWNPVKNFWGNVSSARDLRSKKQSCHGVVGREHLSQGFYSCNETPGPKPSWVMLSVHSTYNPKVGHEDLDFQCLGHIAGHCLNKATTEDVAQRQS